MSEIVSVPRDAPEAMWDGLPRAIMLWLSFDRPTPAKLFDHLRCSGHEVPAWMREEGELKALNHVPSKGTRCVLIYRAMVENWLASVGRNPEGEDREDGLRAEHEHAVGEAETPTSSRQSNKPGREM